jgi:hypothetical protein
MIPMILMFVITAAAMAFNLREYFVDSKWHLLGIASIIAVLEIWMIAEAMLQLKER